MTTTGIILTATFCTLGIYDLVVVLRNGVGCSISRCMQKAGFKSPIVSLVIGMILGHFWLYMSPEITDEDVRGYISRKVDESKNAKSAYTVPSQDYDILFVPKGVKVDFRHEKEDQKTQKTKDSVGR
jgi:putative intracellular protease/amidase